MQGQAGPIHEINFDNQTATINIDVFGRNTPTEVSFDDLKKVK